MSIIKRIMHNILLILTITLLSCSSTMNKKILESKNFKNGQFQNEHGNPDQGFWDLLKAVERRVEELALKV